MKNYIEIEKVEISCDRETASRCGADGTFQVEQVIIVTEFGRLDVTKRIDQGKHYYNLDDVVSDLGLSGVNVEEV